jgi:hypothetical protein
MMRLGKLPPQLHPHTLRLGKYLAGDLLPAPATKVYREYKTPEEAKQMFGNNRYGDCVFAMLANLLILATCHTGKVFVPTEEDVLRAYADVTGFDPATGANDNGTVMTDALEYMRATGIAGHKILGWAQIDHTNLAHRQLGVDLFGATLVGVNFPESAMLQFENGQSWRVEPRSRLDGGHAILHPGYGRLGDDYVTWGKWDQKAAAAWSYAYVDEEYVAITPDWVDRVTGKTPGGLDLATLEKDLSALAA